MDHQPYKELRQAAQALQPWVREDGAEDENGIIRVLRQSRARGIEDLRITSA